MNTTKEQDMNDTATILVRLNTYKGENIWQDVIYQLDDLDHDRTEALDPNYQSDRFALTDGRVFVFDIDKWVLQ